MGRPLSVIRIKEKNCEDLKNLETNVQNVAMIMDVEKNIIRNVVESNKWTCRNICNHQKWNHMGEKRKTKNTRTNF